MKKLYFLILVGLIVSRPLFAQHPMSERIANLIDALNTKNSKALIAQLDDSCKIANLPRGCNAIIIPLVLKNYGAIQHYQIVNETPAGPNYKVQLDVVYNNGVSGHPWFILNADKVIEMHIIKDIILKKEDEIGKAILGGKLPDEMTIPFQLYDRLIYVSATVNGQKGFFMLDSGSPVILLNKRYFPDSVSSVNVSNQLNLTGLSGKMDQVSLKTIQNLRWGQMELTNFKAASVAMAENPAKGPAGIVFGLLGFEVFKDYEVTFDYPGKLLRLVKTDASGNYIGKPSIKTTPLVSVPLQMQRHLPVIEFDINGKQFHMALDCGANTNVLFLPYFKDVSSSFSEPIHQRLTTADSTDGDIATSILDSGIVGRLAFKNMLTALSSDHMYMSDPNNKLNIDGLLGEPFFRQYIISINFNKNMINFYK